MNVTYTEWMEMLVEDAADRGLTVADIDRAGYEARQWFDDGYAPRALVKEAVKTISKGIAE